jgi:heterodisulfide reductase subunit A
MIAEIEADENIHLHLNTEIDTVDGFVGSFKTTVSSNGEEEILEHGVTIIASGASELKPDPQIYPYGEDARVLTGLELDRKFIANDDSLKLAKAAAFIQCVGSRIEERPYCSKVCCTHSVKSALTLKEINPEMDIFIVHRDIRTYGLQEDLYREARSQGIQFLRYDFDQGLVVREDGPDLQIRFVDTTLRRRVEIRPDLLVLASAIVPPQENPLAQLFKIPLNADGFFVEAHVKLRPVDFATDGIFLCGLAHAPKPIDESISQAQAAATRAITLLARQKIKVSGHVAQVNPHFCSSCGVCVKLCPYAAPGILEEGPFAGNAEINPVLCKGCGLCVASCRSGAINLKGFGTDQIMAMIDQV